MDDQQALKVLIALANGIHPLTGEIFAHDSPYQAPTVIRALFVAVRALESTTTTVDRTPSPLASGESTSTNIKARTAEKNGAGRINAGKPWSSEEDSALLAAFDAQQTLAELATAHGRTQNGVRARLEKHGRLPPSDATRWTHTANQGSQVRDSALPT